MKKTTKVKLSSFFVILGLMFVVSGLIIFTNLNSVFLQTSVVQFKEHKAFDGTTYPIKKAPNWSSLSAQRYNLEYSAYTEKELSDIPYYDPQKLAISADTLKWNNETDKLIRNAKITYSVPYMGNYKLDGKEYAGSHSGVDIKIPTGTPVYAMANGTVIKATNQTTGFGNHIVLQHNNFPSIDNSSAKTVIYSSYNHLSKILISEGDTVTKGQQIGLSGSSGTSTTPHLHFQIDNSNAPYHPYWPFTWKEASDAGLDFFSAINAGLGKEKAIQTTINPLLYVQKYSNTTNSEVYVQPVTPSTTVNTTAPTVNTPANNGVPAESYVSSGTVLTSEETVTLEVPEETVTPETEVISVPEVIEDPVLTVNITVDDSYLGKGDKSFKLSLRDQFGKEFKDGFKGDALISSAKNNIKLNSKLLNVMSFDNEGNYSGYFTIINDGEDRITVEIGSDTFVSKSFVVEKGSEDFVFSDLRSDSKYYDSVKYLYDKGIVNGYADGTFKPQNTVSRIEAIKFILEGTNVPLNLGKVPFRDTSTKEWYGKYLYTAYKKGVVGGYDDKTFKPGNLVTRAEFFKILLTSMDTSLTHSSVSPFTDVNVDDWFAPYLITARDLGIIDQDVTIVNPNEPMTREEVAYAIYKMMNK